MATVVGCAHVSPRIVVRDRFDYGQSVADSWKREMLLNVVRIRYADAPMFMDVTTVINSYSIATNGNAGVRVGGDADPVEAIVGGGLAYSNTPTVTYQPLTGDRFMRSLLRPIPPVAVFQMLQTGWSADMLLRITVRTINGLRNATRGTAADPQFEQLIAAASRLQEAGGVNIRVEERTGGEAVVIALPEPSGGAASADRAAVQRLLGLDPNATDYSLAFGLTPRSPNEVAVLTRSMIEVMVEYGYGIDVPETDRTEGRVAGAALAASALAATRLVQVLSGPEPPADAYASVRYRGRWYWVPDRDLTSKLRFTLLMILSSLAETGVAPATPVITVPSR